MAKRGKASRRVDRRKEILDATLRVLAAAGTAGVTHRAVAAEAGVALASTTYHFSSKDDLLTEAFIALAQREREAMTLGLEEIPSALTVRDAAYIIAEIVSEDVGPRSQLRAEFEMHLAAGRRPELQQTHREYADAGHRFFAEIARRAGCKRPELDGGLILTVATGLQLGELAAPTDGFRDEVAFPLFLRLLDALSG